MGFLRIMIFFLLLLPGAAFAAQLGSAKISLIRGDVQIYNADTEDWVAASINTPLREGDRLWVPEGARAEIHVHGGVYVRLGSATSFDILALQEESYQFYLNGGHLYLNNRQGGIDHIQVDTPLSSVGCYDNSLVMVDVAESGATEVSVIKGYSLAETRSGKTRVEAGNTLHVGPDMFAELSPLAPPDEWESWNRERDRKIVAANRSIRYLPEELDDYAYELDEHGRWVYVTDYGYCWTPLRASADWAPYRDGRWVWVGGNYVWISYEPWGWTPYHYGRWAFVANFGWCWVPPRTSSVYWAPGYVGWVYTPTYVAWVPLAPGDLYYGYGHFGPLSVNITNVTINRTVVREFRNVNVRNAVTVVNRTTFISGRREPVRVRGNPFRAADVQVGPPAIRPARETAMPALRRVPEARRPPERVRRVSVEEIRRERKVVREERGSVFTPGRPGAEMPVRRRSEPQRVIRRERAPRPESRPERRERPAPRIERQPPAREPEILRGRPVPPPEKPAPALEERKPAAPGQPKPETRGESPGRGRREPRWQEPIPSVSPAPQRRPAPSAAPPGEDTRKREERREMRGPARQEPAPAARPEVQRPEAPPQPSPQQAVPRSEAPAKGRERGPGAAPRKDEEKKEAAPERERKRQRQERGEVPGRQP